MARGNVFEGEIARAEWKERMLSEAKAAARAKGQEIVLGGKSCRRKSEMAQENVFGSESCCKKGEMPRENVLGGES